MKKTLAIILSFVMLFGVMASVYVSGNSTYSYNTVQDFNGYAENEINRVNGKTVNENGLKTKCNKSGSSFVTSQSLVSSTTGETIYYGYDNSMGLKMWSNASGEYLEAYVPVTSEMRSGAVGFRIWFKNRSLSMSNLQLRYYAQKDGTEYVYKKTGYSVDIGSEGYLELMFDDTEIQKHTQTPSYTNIDVSQVPEYTSFDYSEDLTYIGFMINCTSSGIISADNFEIISADEPAEEDTTVPTEPEEEESSSTTTTTTTQAPDYDGETVVKDVFGGGEWVNGWWSADGQIVIEQEVHKKRAAYTTLLKVLPNTTYTITTKISGHYALNFKEYDVNKSYLSLNTNFKAYDLGSNFTTTLTTSANTEYISVCFWNSSEENMGSDLYNIIKAGLDSGEFTVAITGKVAVDELEVVATMKRGAALRLGAVNGLRFYTQVNTEKIAALQDKGAIVEVGTLIAPKDILDNEELTFDLDSNKFINVPFDLSYGYYEEGNTFVGSIVDIKESGTSYSAESGNITRNFVGRGYVKVTLDGRTYISYASYADNNKANNTRSLKTVATAFKADATQSALYEAHKEKVDKWASALLAVMEVSQDMIGGNINVHDIVENADGTYTVTVSNQLRTTTEDWFYWAFKVEGAQGKTVKFKFNQSNRVGYYGAAVSKDLENWEWTNTASGESFTYTFGEDDTRVYFAHNMLYHPERFYDLAEELNLTVQTLCTSEGGNLVPYVKFGTGDKGMVLTARHHACESTGSYVLEGVLKQLATSDYIKENYTVMCVPFVDIDGVLAGDQGKNRAPHDHNRDYVGEFGETEKSIYASVRAIRAYIEDPANNVVQAYDSHSPWHKGGDNDQTFVYKKLSDDRLDNINSLLTLFKDNLDSNCFAYNGSADLEPGEAGNTGTDGTDGSGLSSYMLKIPTLECGFTIETPFFRSGSTKYSQENSVNMGKAFGDAIIEFSKTIGSK